MSFGNICCITASISAACSSSCASAGFFGASAACRSFCVRSLQRCSSPRAISRQCLNGLVAAVWRGAYRLSESIRAASIYSQPCKKCCTSPIFPQPRLHIRCSRGTPCHRPVSFFFFCLNVFTHVLAFFEIYKICNPLHRSRFKILEKIVELFHVFVQNSAKIVN